MNVLNQKRRGSAFTLIELLVVISIIAIIASLIVGAAKLAGQKRIRSRVQAELSALQTAIDSYHAKLGFYPPDGKDAAKPPLFYELKGTKKNGTAYQVLNGVDQINVGDIQNIFGRDGFANANPDEAQDFYHELKTQQHQRPSGVAADFLVVPSPGPNDLPPQNAGEKPLNIWHYTTGSRPTPNDLLTATNNPATYDLWAEVMVSGKVEIIGNWKIR